MISVNALRALVVEEGLSDNELRVLSLALDGRSPGEIKTDLGIPTENAVQKKLSKIYAKFRITGAGPGKLPKLQRILTDRFQAEQDTKVLICWSGSAGKRQAYALRDVILNHPKVETWIPDVDMADSQWLTEVNQFLENVEFGIACLANKSSENPAVNCAIGLLAGKIRIFKLAKFGNKKLPEPLRRFPDIDVKNRSDLDSLLNEIIGGDAQEARDWVNFRLSKSDWLNTVTEELPEDSDLPSRDNSANYESIVEVGKRILKDNDYFIKNKVFQEIIINLLTDTSKQIESVKSNRDIYSFPLELYPRYLVSLQQNINLNICVKAISIVENIDYFWAIDKGDEIGGTANSESERLFVFLSKNDLKKSKSFLAEHASKYKVFLSTLDSYLPLVEKFSDKYNLINKWENSDLPIKEYAIIKSPKDLSKVLIWHDENEYNNKQDKRSANCSAVMEYVNLYEDAFDEIIKSSSVQRLSSKIVKPQGKTTANWQQFTEEIFRSSFPISIRTNPEQILEDLQSLRNDLIVLKTKEDVIETALRNVRERLNSQTVSIFLFGKDGCLHRMGIQGTDIDEKPIDNSWFSEEHYAIGESFTGQTVKPDKNGYGRPQWTNCLADESLDQKSKNAYLRKLGSINCAIAVPLDGQSKTYGVLEVINKIDPNNGKILPYSRFTQDEISWLSAIGSAVANALSNSRRNRQCKLYADLANFLVQSPKIPEDAYQEVARRLISNETAFKVCVLRVKDNLGFLHVKAIKGVDEITLSKRENEPRKIGEGFPGNVVDSGQPIIVREIDTRINEFGNNRKWASENNLKSFACFPLISEKNILGTLSLYTGYKYDFHDSCINFLKRVTSLVAAFIQRVNDLDRRREIRQELCAIRDSIGDYETKKRLDSICNPSKIDVEIDAPGLEDFTDLSLFN